MRDGLMTFTYGLYLNTTCQLQMNITDSLKTTSFLLFVVSHIFLNMDLGRKNTMLSLMQAGLMIN